MDRGAPPPTRVFLVDGRELLRRGVADLLAAYPELEVVGEAARAADVLPRVRATRPDVVLLGELPPARPEDARAEDDAVAAYAAAVGAGSGAGGHGAPATLIAAVCRDLRAEAEPPACLLLAPVHDERALNVAERAGAAGCVPEDVHGDDLVAALQRLAVGAPLYGRESARDHDRLAPARALPPEPPDPLEGLSATDREIVALIGEGLTNRQIGNRLGLSERTIKNHVSHILATLAMERRTQIAALASTLRLTV